MIYVEKFPMKVEAYKFIGAVDDELKNHNIIPPNPFQYNITCPVCGKTLKDHALYGVGNNFKSICPNQYIIIGKDGGIQLMSVENFEKIYCPLNVEDVEFKEIEENAST